MGDYVSGAVTRSTEKYIAMIVSYQLDRIQKKYMFNIFKRKCPKCGGVKITVIKESFNAKLARYMKYMLLFITILFVKAPPDQYVCKDCGFTWHKM